MNTDTEHHLFSPVEWRLFRRANTTNSYMLVYCGGPPGQSVIWYQYARARGHIVSVTYGG